MWIAHINGTLTQLVEDDKEDTGSSRLNKEFMKYSAKLDISKETKAKLSLQFDSKSMLRKKDESKLSKSVKADTPEKRVVAQSWNAKSKFQSQTQIIESHSSSKEKERDFTENISSSMNDEVKYKMENDFQYILGHLEKLSSEKQMLYQNRATQELLAWDLKYQIFLDLLAVYQNDYDNNMRYSELLFDHIGKFRRTATFFVELIISTMHLNEKYELGKRYKSTSLDHPDINDTLNDKFIYISDDADQLYYIFNKIVIKIASRNTMLHYKNTKTNVEYQEPAWKASHREFNSMDTLFDSLFIISKPNSKYKLTVPLSCYIYYKGYSALAVAEIPTAKNEIDPIIGLNNDGKYITTQSKSLISQLAYVGEILNLKEINFYFSEYPQKLCISPLIEIHKRNNALDSHVEHQDNVITKGLDLKKTELLFNEEVYYLLKTKEMFPIDYSFVDKKQHDCYLRPEYIINYSKPIRSDLLKKRLNVLKSSKAPYNEDSQKILDEFEQQKKTYDSSLSILIKELESLNIIPLDSKTLSQTLHSFGINMRYLGKLYDMCKLEHLKEIFAVEMLARRCKQYLTETITEFIEKEALAPSNASYMREQVDIKQQLKSFDSTHFFNENYILAGESEKRKYLELLNEKFHCSILEYYVEFLNMVFGRTAESDAFWDKFAIKTAEYYLLEGNPKVIFHKNKINFNALVFALIYHLGLILNFDENTEINHAPQPFQLEDLSGIVPRTKIYGMRTLMYRKIAEKYKEYQKKGQLDLALKSLKLRMVMNSYIEGTDTVALAETAEILLEEGFAKEAIEKAEEGLRNVHPLNSNAVKFYSILMKAYSVQETYKETQKLAESYFFKSLKTLDFHLGTGHPLHTTIYGSMACICANVQQFQQAESLFLASEICCKRVLGLSHIKTAEVYLDLGKLYLKMGKKDDAERCIQLSNQTFELLNDEVQIASSAFHLAIIYLDQRRFKDALKLSRRATDIYQELFSRDKCAIEILIISMWLTLCAAFSTSQDSTVLEQSVKIFNHINIRKVRIKEEKEVSAQLNDKIQLIQQKTVIAILVSTMRITEQDQRKALIHTVEELYKGIDQPNLKQIEIKTSYLDNMELSKDTEAVLNQIIDREGLENGRINNYIKAVVASVMSNHNEESQSDYDNSSNKYKSSPESDVFMSMLRMFDQKELIAIME